MEMLTNKTRVLMDYVNIEQFLNSYLIIFNNLTLNKIIHILLQL